MLVVAMLLASACAAADDAPPAGEPPMGSSPATSPPAPSPTLGPDGTSTTSARPAPTTSLPEPPTALPLAGNVVVIDPGHNGQNFAHPDEIGRLVDIGNGTKPCNSTGTESADGLTEAELNWDVAQRARDALVVLGAEVVLTRQDNEGWGPCIDRRAAVGNDVAADAVVSIHADGGPETARGFHVIHPVSIAGLTDDIAQPSLRLAEALHATMRRTAMPVADYTAVDGLAERSDLGGLNLSDVPAVFLEMGNMRNVEDATLFADVDFRDAVAAAVAAAVVAFLER